MRLVQKVDRSNKDVMWCFAEFTSVQLAARAMKVLQVSPPSCVQASTFLQTINRIRSMSLSLVFSICRDSNLLRCAASSG